MRLVSEMDAEIDLAKDRGINVYITRNGSRLSVDVSSIPGAAVPPCSIVYDRGLC